MPKIEDYALIGDCKTAALVSSEGSIDWFCVPRFDSGACFARLLGDDDNGFWCIRPKSRFQSRRRYRENTLILETDFQTTDGVVRIVDCMLMDSDYPRILRLVKGLSGRVAMEMELVIRFDYGAVIPWVNKIPFGGMRAVAGTNSLRLKTTAGTFGKNMRTHSDFVVEEGESYPFLLSWNPSHHVVTQEVDEPDDEVERLAIWWQDWIRRCEYDGPYASIVHRSLITLKALTYKPTGGIIAAPTTSLPEEMGGERNWDYRYCWLRDSTLTLRALIVSGYREEALAWRDWLLRAVAGTPEQIMIMYGIGGERNLTEREMTWLKGFGGSKPVRVGNGAAKQFQLDVFGGLLDTFLEGRKHGLRQDGVSWRVEKKIIDFVEGNWRKRDRGIWEVRGPEQHFTYSKSMCWVAMDRGVQSVRSLGCKGDAERWSSVADEIKADIFKNGYDEQLGCFTQAYGSKTLDASTLLMPLMGFLPATDPRMVRTTLAIEERLMSGGFVQRYLTSETADGLPGKEGAFLACSLWLVDNWIQQGEHKKAVDLFERVLTLQNDVGLYSEEYDANKKRFLGNFPQAFTHVAIVNTAFNLSKSLRALS